MRSRQLIYRKNRRKIQYNDVTICENDNSSVNSGTDGGNSDIGVLADFSDDDEKTRVEEPYPCEFPGCQCGGGGGGIDFTKLVVDMTDTEDPEYEGPMDRANRLCVESYNYDLPRG